MAVVVIVLLLCVCCLFFACKKNKTNGFYAEVTDDFKTEYYVGDAFVAAGSLKAYSDKTHFDLIPITADMVTGFDTSAAGDVILTVTYGEFVATVPIRVSAVAARVITLNADTVPSVIFEGDPFPSGVTFSVEMSDGTTRPEIPVTVAMLGGFNSSFLGNQNITVTYLGATATFSVRVKEDVPISIRLVDAQYTYYVGDPVSAAGAHIDVTYESRKVQSAAFTTEMVSGFSTEEGGTQTATVTYKGLTCDYAYFVKKIDAIALVEAQSVYAVNAAVTAQGAHLELTYNDGDVREAAFSVDLVSDFSTATGGDHRATVTYEGLRCNYDYFVQKAPIAFALNAASLPASFEKGDDFPSGGTGVLTYDDRTSGEVSVSAVNVRDFDTRTMGEKTISITVEGFSDDYTYSVLPEIMRATPYGYTSAAMQGSAFDGLGELIVVYETGERESIALSDARISVQYRSDETGDIEQIARFRREDTPFTVHIYSESERNAVERIELAGVFPPIKIGDEIDVSGVQVTIIYKYLTATTVECDSSWVTLEMPPSITSDCIDLPLTVSCFGATAEDRVRVLSEEYCARVTAINVMGVKRLYAVGDTLSIAKATLSAAFGGGYEYRQGIAVDPSYISDFDTSTAGEKIMTVTYEGAFTQLSYRVITEEEKATVTGFSINGFSPLLFAGDDIDDIDRDAYSLALTFGYGYETAQISLSSGEITLAGGPFDEVGRAEVIVSYAGIDRAFSVTVRDPAAKTRVTSIRVADEICTYVGTSLDLSAYNLEVTYGYGYEKKEISLDSEGIGIEPFSLRQAGAVRVKITYSGCECGAYVVLEAGESENVPEALELATDSKRIFEVGDALSGVFVIATYRGGKRERIAVTEEMVVPAFSVEEAGTFTATIAYGNVGTVYTYTVQSTNVEE